MKALLDFIVDILKVPSILVGIIALIGLIAQKKSAADTIKGTIKTILGFIVLGGGASVLLGSLNPLGDIFKQAFDVQGVVPNNEAIVSAALQQYGTATALIMAFGMVANIAIARFTRLKFIFLTGHHTFYMACMIAVILVVAGFEGVQLVLVGALTLGLIMAFFPFIAQPFMRDITGSDEVGFGHFGTVGYVLAGLVGRSLRGKSRSTEEMNLPKNLSFLRDSSVSIALTMMVIYLVLVIAAGAESVQVQFSKGQNYLVWAVIQAITFAAGVFIILQGVRLILAEIVPAFTGFSQKLVPNARPALDCPIVFPYAPNAVLVGFLASFAGGLVGLFILGQLHWVLILPGVVPHFFCGATAPSAVASARASVPSCTVSSSPSSRCGCCRCWATSALPTPPSPTPTLAWSASSSARWAVTAAVWSSPRWWWASSPRWSRTTTRYRKKRKSKRKKRRKTDCWHIRAVGATRPPLFCARPVSWGAGEGRQRF